MPEAGVVAAMAFNFLSSVGIIFVNKIIFKTYHFNYASFVTCCHFFATIVGLKVLQLMGVYEHKPLRQMDVLPISAAFCIHVVFNNLSLQYNSVGFYQLMKVLTSPVIAVLQEVFMGVPLHWKLKGALVVVCAGVCCATVNDVEVNMIGTLWAVAGLLGAAFYQLWVKTRTKALGANSFQLLHYQAPQSLLCVFFLIPAFDQVTGPKGLLAVLPTVPSNSGLFGSLLLGSSLAFCVNLSVYLVISRTSPITYNVLGHFKLCIILAGGIVFFHGDTQPKVLFGIVTTFVGVVLYTHLKQNIAENWDKKGAGATTDVAK